MFAEWQGFNKSVLGILGCQEAKLGELLGGKQMKQYAIRFPLRRAPVLHYNSEGSGSNHITQVLKTLPSAWLAYFYVQRFWESPLSLSLIHALLKIKVPVFFIVKKGSLDF